MSLQLDTATISTRPLVSPKPPECPGCPGARSGFCHAAIAATALPPAHQRATKAHRNVYVAGQRIESMTVICEGWATRYVQLSDGRRQILSILLPGDPISPSALFKDSLDFSVQSLTPVRTCHYDRDRMRGRMPHETNLLEAIIALFTAEREQADRSLIDLGQRPADERIARFFLQLLHRLRVRGLAEGQTFACPLRQRHIADAMGLTAVHVNRIIGHFRRAGLMDAADGRVTILNLPIYGTSPI